MNVNITVSFSFDLSPLSLHQIQCNSCISGCQKQGDEQLMITVEQCASVWRNESVPAMLIFLNGWLCYPYFYLLYHFSNDNITTNGSGNGQILVNVLPCVQNYCKTGMSSGAHSPGHLVTGCSQGPILRPHFSQQFVPVTDFTFPQALLRRWIASNNDIDISCAFARWQAFSFFNDRSTWRLKCALTVWWRLYDAVVAKPILCWGGHKVASEFCGN